MGASAEEPGVLYISYDGMLEPLGQSQVLAYLEKLAPGRRIHLISFEKSQDWEKRPYREEIARRIGSAEIRWHPLRYHKSPSVPATAYDIAAGSALAITLAARHRLRIVHARSYVAGLMGLAAKRATGARLLFDMRGFWADERIDSGLWSKGGRLYRGAKDVERRLLLASDHVVTLTHASESELQSFSYLAGRTPPITVTPTCTDLDMFRIQGPPKREPFTAGYVGSVGTWYLLDEMLEAFGLIREAIPDARLIFVNRNEHDLIRQRASAFGVDDALTLTEATHAEMPLLIGGMSVAMALITPAYSKIASAPTKLGEYLGCGVPCLGNSRVGDVEEVLERDRVGVAMSSFEADAMRADVTRLIALAREDGVQQRCRDVAVHTFSLERGVAAYDAIYRNLAAGIRR